MLCLCVQYLPPVHSTGVAYVPYFFFSSVKTEITHLAMQFLFGLLSSVLLCNVCRLSGRHFNISTYWQNLDNRNCQYFAPPFLIDTSWCLYRRYGIPINWGQFNSSCSCYNWTYLNRSIWVSLSKDPPKTLAKRNWLFWSNVLQLITAEHTWDQPCVICCRRLVGWLVARLFLIADQRCKTFLLSHHTAPGRS